MEEKKFETVNFKKKYLGAIVTGQDGQVYRSISLPEGGSILRKQEQVRQSEYREDEVYFNVPSDYVFNKQSYARDEASGEFIETSEELSVSDLKDRFNNAEYYEAENEFKVITCSKKRLIDVFKTLEGKECVSIAVTNDTRIIRKTEQVKEIEGTDFVKFVLPRDFEIQALKKVKTENGFVDEKIPLTTDSLQQMLTEELQGFVRFVVPQKYISEPHKGKENKTFCFVNIPGVGSFVRNADSIKKTKSDDEKVIFYIPAGYDIKVTTSRRIAGVPDDVPENEKYKKEEHVYSVLDLKRNINEKLEKELGKSENLPELPQEELQPDESYMPDFMPVGEEDEIPDFFKENHHKTR